jgi:hypothetical protein
MAEHPSATGKSLIPPKPVSREGRDFANGLSTRLDGQSKDDSIVNQAFAGSDPAFDRLAASLYSLAAMLIGEGEDTVNLVEHAVSHTEISACDDAKQAHMSSRRALAVAAVELLERRQPGCLAAPTLPVAASGCIDDDDLDAAGAYGKQLQEMMGGPQRDKVRTWLNNLPIASRVIFALRAVAGFTSTETASLLAAHAGPRAAWTAASVREIFRQGLCSLATQLIHATTPR